MDFDLNRRGDRIRYVREEILGIPAQETLAARLGVSRGAVGNWELDKPISRKNLKLLEQASGVPAAWIDEREGEDPHPRAPRLAQRGPLIDLQGDAIIPPTDGVKEIDAAAGMGGGQHVQFAYEDEGDGNHHPVDAFKPEPWIFPRSFHDSGLKAPASAVIAMATQGDSMAPTIQHGDVVLIDTRHQRISPPGIYALRDIYGEIIVKRLDIFRVDGRVIVKITSDNPHEPTRDEPASEVAIVGRVCGIVKIT
jgi:phage repressor protein C with HTH and peptisase S24 domain